MRESSTEGAAVTGRHPCEECLIVKHGLFGRLLGLSIVYDSNNDCDGRGPESITKGGYVEVDYRKSSAHIERDIARVCPLDVSMEMRRASTRQEGLLYDRFEEAVAELERRRANQKELSIFDRQKVETRSYVFSTHA